MAIHKPNRSSHIIIMTLLLSVNFIWLTRQLINYGRSSIMFSTYTDQVKDMKQLKVSTESLNFFEAMSSVTRIKIVEMLGKCPMNIREIAQKLGLSSAIVTRHIDILEKAEIVACEFKPGKHGVQRICRLDMDELALRFRPKKRGGFSYRYSVPVGQYSDHEIQPTCGLAGRNSLIGMLDDPRYFSDPEHNAASLIWFGSGFLEYHLPNYLLENQKAKSLKISLEICSEAPGYNEKWPSEITFSVNGIEIGSWNSPGDFGGRKGVLTPEWYTLGTQYGLLKTITVNRSGSYIDGIQFSNQTIQDLSLFSESPITFRIISSEKHGNSSSLQASGGVSLFGRYFGNYRQDIEVCLEYEKSGNIC